MREMIHISEGRSLDVNLIISKSLRDEATKKLSELAGKFLSFEKEVNEKVEVIASTKWLKADVTAILDIFTKLKDQYRDNESKFAHIVYTLENDIRRALYDEYVHKNIFKVDREFIELMCEWIATVIADINPELYGEW